MRLACFTPLPPTRSGIAAYSAELLPGLAASHDVDTFIDGPPEPGQHATYDARDFVWRHLRQPYDLTVYQLGNATCHDYMWGYLFHHPGLVVMHDAQLHQARALALTKRWMPRTADYLAEMRANHPDAPPDLGHMFAAGLGGTLFGFWPLTRLVIEAARLTVVHNRRLATDLVERHPDAAIAFVDMGVRDTVPADPAAAAAAVRARHGIPAEAVVVAAFGGITPEKRIPELLAAASAVAGRHPALHVLLVGAGVDHLDVEDVVAGRTIAPRVHTTGYVPDEELGDYLAAADICACLRWPTNRETSASWLRCLCAGRATIVTDLAHLGDVPTLDPRSWRVVDAGGEGPRPPVAVSIDILDERHSLELALDRLAGNATLRSSLGRQGRKWWDARHRLEDMVREYGRVIEEACARPPGRVALPGHLVDRGTARARAIAADVGVSVDFLGHR